jgi:hypothetical protein
VEAAQAVGEPPATGGPATGPASAAVGLPLEGTPVGSAEAPEISSRGAMTGNTWPRQGGLELVVVGRPVGGGGSYAATIQAAHRCLDQLGGSWQQRSGHRPWSMPARRRRGRSSRTS